MQTYTKPIVNKLPQQNHRFYNIIILYCIKKKNQISLKAIFRGII